MTGRRKGTPCACSDDCGCSSSRNCVRAVNNVSPDPNGDLVIRGGQGIDVIQSGDNLVINNTANPNAFVAGDNIEMTPSGDDIEISLTQDPVINGDLTVNGDIIQNGAAYETHAEHIYTADDYIIMRDGAIAALAPGDYSGFQVKLYDGVNDGGLVIDNSGTARVGDVGDEQPLMTRDESADLTNDHLLKWDAANFKAIDAGVEPSDFMTSASSLTQLTIAAGYGGTAYISRAGKIVTLHMEGMSFTTTGFSQHPISDTIPKPKYGVFGTIFGPSGQQGSLISVSTSGVIDVNVGVVGFLQYGSVTYITDDP